MPGVPRLLLVSVARSPSGAEPSFLGSSSQFIHMLKSPPDAFHRVGTLSSVSLSATRASLSFSAARGHRISVLAGRVPGRRRWTVTPIRGP